MSVLEQTCPCEHSREVHPHTLSDHLENFIAHAIYWGTNKQAYESLCDWVYDAFPDDAEDIVGYIYIYILNLNYADPSAIFKRIGFTPHKGRRGRSLERRHRKAYKKLLEEKRLVLENSQTVSDLIEHDREVSRD